MIIRPMESRDFAACERVAREAFWNVYRPGAVEHLIVRRLETAPEAEPRLAFVAEADGEIVGCVMCAKGLLMWPCGSVTEHLCVGPLAVLPEFQGKGVGSALMDAAEAVAARYADAVYLGVGLHEGYGSAQRLYVKRGYIPDGTGVWYGEKVCPQYGDCRNDDSLVLYLSKQLK